jgi:D-alanyl-D-alanine carboxypeptidase-like protein
MVDLNDPRRADARGWGPVWSATGARRTDMVPLIVDDVSFVGGVHPRLHDLLKIILISAVADGYQLKRDPTQTWGFAWRPIRGSLTVPTNHSSGTAIDINSAYNWLGRADGGDVPQWLVDRFNRYGFRWGGDYVSRPDPMHWEAMFEVGEVDRLTTMAEEEFMGLTPEEKEDLKRATAFLDALTGPLKPGTDRATAAGAGERVAKAVKAFERSIADPDGTEH